MRNPNPQLVLLLCGIVISTACSRTSKHDDRFEGPKFREHIRSSPARTPEEQRTGFVLPEGFEIQLYASEPDIGKPINLTFDAKGRMWVTQSFEYPFAARTGEGKDRITILEDTDGDGTADVFTNFSDTLNIPIGVFPLLDGAVAYSIPAIYRFTDADLDGKPESVKPIIGPFQHRDTHGMVNNFFRGYDGWIHACHGFTNQSTVAGSDGDSIKMVSGNTFRFRPDGSRVEHMTHGRINPFGLAFDERGYLYSTDCHTSPLYQLIRGGDYMQWGKEEGMGFAPDMKPLEKEATALAGIAYYSDKHYPREYQSNFYIGDAVASRVYRNSFVFKGSTPVGKLEEEFVLSDDPWFRPVDVKLGPDGALYIADFYNSIIGHYEVPLDHPQRDRVRGRIWRVTYKGAAHERRDLTTASAKDLIAALAHDNLIVRFSAADQLVERLGPAASDEVLSLVEKKDVTGREYIHGLWVLHRLNTLSDDLIVRSASHNDPLIRLHTMRIMLESNLDASRHFSLVSKALADSDPHVRRAATELLVKFPGMVAVEHALAERHKVPAEDSHQLYTIRLVLRTLLRNEEVMSEVAGRDWERRDARALVDVMVGVPSEDAAEFLSRYIQESDWKGDRLVRQYEHLARFIPEGELSKVIAEAERRTSADVDRQYLAFKGVQQGIARRGGQESAELISWGEQLAGALLQKYPAGKSGDSKEGLAIQRFAVETAGKYKMKDLESRILTFVDDDVKDIDVRLSALRSLLTLDAGKHADEARKMLEGPTSPQLKNRATAVLADFPGPSTYAVLADVKDAAPDLQSAVAIALASTPEGREILLAKVNTGDILPRTLLQPRVKERLFQDISPDQAEAFEAITSKLEPASKERQVLIDTRVLAFNTAAPQTPVAPGKELFKQNCAACHSIGGEGGAIGPQLDGVGKWGARALAEKIIDPNRNVSEAFRVYTINTKDGRVLSGLYRRGEGEVIIFADIAGKEFSVAKENIAGKKASTYTLMPDHFGEILTQDDFNALLKYLLSLQS